MSQRTGFGVFVAILGLAVLTAAALLHEWIGEEGPAGVAPRPAAGAPAPAAAAGGRAGARDEGPLPAAWAIFRGDRRLFGRARGELPDPPKPRWSFRTGGAVKSSPVIGGGRVIVGSCDGRLYAIDLVSGTQVWAYRAADAFEAPPVLAAGTVYAGSLDGVFHAVGAEDGKLRWTFRTGAKIVGSANVLPGPDRESVGGILVGSHDGFLYCLDPADGRALWTFETENYINGAPSVGGGNIAFGGCDGQLRMLSPEGKELMQVDAGSYVPASVAFDGRRAYAGVYGNELLCADMVSGKVEWRYGDAENGSPFFSSPAVGADRVLIGSQDRRVHCVGRRDGKRLWTFETRGDVDGSPVICGSKAVFGSADGGLYVVNLSDGGLVWSHGIGSRLSSSPAVADGVIVIGAEDGSVHAFGN